MATEKRFRYFSYFYHYLKYRVFIFCFLSLLVGFLDGMGLALFIPLLKLVARDNTDSSTGEEFITDFILNVLEIPLTLFNILSLILFFFCLKGVVKLVEGYVRVLYQQYFMRTIRISNIDLLNGVPYINFTKMDAGRIQNTFSGEVGRVNRAFSYFFKAFQQATLVFIYVAFAFSIDFIFSLIVTTGGFVIHLLFKIFYKRTRYLSGRLTSQAHRFEGLLIQKVSFFNYLKTTGLNRLYGDKLKNIIYTLEKDQKRIGVIDSVLIALREPLVILVVTVAIFLQHYFFNKDIALILLSLLLLYRALTFFMALQENWNTFLGLSGSLENIREFTGKLVRGQEKNGKLSFTGFKNKLELKNLSFSYDKLPVLQDLNLEIRKNETIALVGESGSGKSTLMRIISGLLFPSEGTYLIDNQPVEDIELYSFRRRIGFVPQEVPVFSDNIFNNVTFWAPKTPENLKRFWKVLHEASIADFVNKQPLREETLMGNSGVNLSGGQKQRIAIARELYKKVDFLLLDEATSSLDGKTEAVIQDNIRELKGKVTIIIIAHRLTTIKFADRIVVLKDGEISQVGSYRELMTKSEIFRRMVEIQHN